MANGFGLNLDTMKPTGSISRGTGEKDQFHNSNFNLTITNTTISATYMKIWFDQTAVSTEVPSTVSWIDISSKKTETFTYTTEFTSETADGQYYYHMKLMDSVNNESDIYNTEIITYDTTAPEVSNVWIKDPDSGSTSITNNLSGNYFGFSYGTTGLAAIDKAVITCNDFNPITINTPTSPYDSSKVDPKVTLTFKGDDGLRTITVTITDQCGNTSSATGSINVDTTIGDLSMNLFKSDGVTALPEKINYSAIKVALKSTEKDIVAYKLWEGSTEPSNWTSLSEVGQLDVMLDFNLSGGDATKTLSAKIKDTAGSETETPVSKSVMVDYTAPVISISSDKSWIAGAAGSDLGTVTTAKLTLTHNEDISGLASWDLKCGDTSIKGSLTSIPETFNLTKDNGMVKGSNTISFIVNDNAGNSSTATVVVNLDTDLPTTRVTSTLNTWYNNWSTFTVSVEATDASSGVNTIYVWTDISETTTTVPTGTSALSTEDLKYPIPSSKIFCASETNAPAQSNSNYIHVQVVDTVGHVGNATAVKFGYDNVAPTDVDATFTRSSYPGEDAVIRVTDFTDATSGVTQLKFTGDITDDGVVKPNTWFSVVKKGEYGVKLKANTTTKSVETKDVQIYAKDAAGNESAQLLQITTERDESIPGASLTLRNATDSAALDPVVCVAQFAARIAGWDDEKTGAKAAEYKLYGDFTYNSQSSTGIKESDIDWSPLEYKSGLTYMLISNMFCTANSEGVTSATKTIYLKVRDDAGNESAAEAQSFTYDTSAPEVNIKAPGADYTIVSKVHTLRRNGDVEVAGKYADASIFTFTPSEVIQAYKVCAYRTLDEAKYSDPDTKTTKRDPAGETAIPTTGGSENMSATGISSAAEVQCTIRGADYETALVARGAVAGSTAEGVHIVVVYVQDLAGQWSDVANFTI